MFFFTVLVGSFIVASSRGIKWNKLFTANRAIVIFYVYFGLSVLWSGDPSGSIKRVAKDFGLLFVAGVIFSEKDTLQAIKAVYIRCAFVLFPLSVVFIKYFPQYSRVYAIEGGITVTGVTTQKNSLGEIVMVFTLFLVWEFMESCYPGARLQWSKISWERVLLLAMGVWLLDLSKSKTALVCTMAGVLLIVRNRSLITPKINRAILSGAILLPLLLFFSQKFHSVIAPLVAVLGRDMTFTGRANIWDHITAQTVNPLIGAGYWNFWGGPGGYAIAQAMNTVIPNAHCGYVDMYLDGGIIGLTFLAILLVVCGGRIVRQLNVSRQKDLYPRVRLAVLIVAIMYNLSESTFARMGPIWFTTLLMLVEFPAKAVANRGVSSVLEGGRFLLDPRSSVTVNQ